MQIFLLILLPVLSFLSGILGLQSDPKTEQRKKWIVVMVLALTAFGSVIVSLQQQRSDASEKKALTLALDNIQGNTIDIKSILVNVFKQNGAAPGLIQSISKGPSLSAEGIKLVQQSVNADDALRSLLSVVLPQNQKQPTTVVYYPKDVDPSNVNGPVLIQTFKNAGFTVQQAQGGERNPNLATNAVWAGEDVPIDQVKFVTLTLMRAGLQIRAIRSFKSAPNGAARKPGTIEIGADAQVQNLQPYSVEQVSSLTSLPKR